MPVQLYECLILLDQSKVAGDVAGAITKLHGTLEKFHAEIVASRPWDDRKLAYQIKNQKKGLYYLIYYKTDAKNVAGIEAEFKLNESLLRWLTINVPVKWQEAMLTVAKDEHALALQVARDEPDPTALGDLGLGGPPRRGGRGHDDEGRD
jgi:small subunit ribosomal protein S6